MNEYIIVFLFSEDLGHKSRLHGWHDVGEGDMKIFLAHLIAMGLVCKGSIPKYWDHGETVKTAFFRTYMGGTEYISEHSVKLTGVRLQFRSSIQPPSS